MSLFDVVLVWSLEYMFSLFCTHWFYMHSFLYYQNSLSHLPSIICGLCEPTLIKIDINIITTNNSCENGPQVQ